MGGKIAILVRKKNGDKVSFKMHSGGAIRICVDDSHVLDEQKFFDRLEAEEFETTSAISMAEHVSFLNSLALFAPYHIGVLLVDHVEKKVFSCNNYRGFMNYTSSVIMGELYRFCGGENPISISDLNLPVDPSEYFGDLDLRRLMRECNNYHESLEFSFNGGHLDVSSFSDLLGAILSSEGIGFDKADVRHAVINYFQEDMKYDLMNYSDIIIKPKGWDVYLGDGSAEHVYKAYEHCKKHSILTDLDELAWADYFEDCQKYESKV